MANKTTDDVSQKMRQLKEHYLMRLTFWKSELEAFLREQDAWNEEKAAALRNLSHNLAGNGGTYGFNDVSRTARAVENSLMTELKPKTLRPLPHSELKDLIAACEQALAAALQDTGVKDDFVASPINDKSNLPLLLVVDDDPDILEMMEGLLTDVRIIGVDNASDALQVIQNQKPNLVLLDDKMATGISGLEMLEKMQLLQQDDHMPVVMLTASDHPQQIMRGLAHGAADYITKPFDPAVFAKKMQERLRKSQISVLIVDDDEPVRELLAHKFRSMGCAVTLAHDGIEALAAMQASPPALALLDRMMPGQDGLFVLQKMREIPALASIPVIFLTVKHHDTDILEGLNHGAADYIVKPFNPEEVVIRCMRLLQKKE